MGLRLINRLESLGLGWLAWNFFIRSPIVMRAINGNYIYLHLHSDMKGTKSMINNMSAGRSDVINELSMGRC